jgi:large subunit ribosomal protein L29
VAIRKEREELRHKTVGELALALRDAKQELYDVRTKIATRQEEDNSRSKMLRRRIARIHTLIGEKVAAGEDVAAAPTAPAAPAKE